MNSLTMFSLLISENSTHLDFDAAPLRNAKSYNPCYDLRTQDDHGATQELEEAASRLCHACH
ncbi:MAG: hypothetical protein Q8N17_18530 [Burkholderiaceae bacterium]|nr:hypothetical protein [Burkholderiaceae bacterium]